MPTFCRHNRFIERCPICSKTLPDARPERRAGAPRRAGSERRGEAGGKRAGARRSREGEGLRVRREGRADDDGFRSPLTPGLRATADAARLAEEIGFSSARLLALAADPPGLYGEARSLAATDIELATWTCLLIAYLSPLEDEADPFRGIREALAAGAGRAPAALARIEGLAEIPLGPRSAHEAARGEATLEAYRAWARQAGSQQLALTGDPGWTPERRFARQFERLALPGLGRAGRYELLLLLGRLGLYELRPDSLHLAGFPQDPTTLAAKRVFGIGDELLLERRAAALAQAASVPVEALDLALANWGAESRATLGFPGQAPDGKSRDGALAALGL